MRTFKDKTGQEWIVELTLDKVKYIESYDFAEALGEPSPCHIRMFPPEEDLFTTKITNPAVCFSMIWCIVREQAASRGIEDELAFAKLFDGRTMQDARLAFYEELPDFFPEMMTTLRTLIGTYSKVQKIADKKLNQKAMKHLSDEQIEKMVEEEINKRLEGNTGIVSMQ